MKTAFSLPEDLFRSADRLARRLGKTRSQVYRAALAEYLHRHSPDEVTAALDRVVAGLKDDGGFTCRASRNTLRESAW